jgi:uncharacterized protein (DUF58 family)
VRPSVGLVPPPVEARAQPNGRLPAAIAPRGLFLIALGLVWAIPAFVYPVFLWAMVAWDLAVVIIWIVDVAGLPAPDALSIRRDWIGPLALSVPSQARVALVNQSAASLHVDLVDAVAHPLRLTPPRFTLTLPPGGTGASDYEVRPAVRGLVSVGDVYLRYRSRFEIGERWARAGLAQTVVAYPNLEAARWEAIRLIRTRQIELERRPARLRGTGRMFESLREYREGDELRDVCWTASARRGRLTTRLYELERSQTVWILLDAGRLMRARESGLSKLDHGVNAALALTEVALGTGDRVGLISYSRRIVQRLPAARGSPHLRSVIEHLARVPEDEWEADHAQAAGRLLSDQRRRSLVVWITDLAETAATPEVVRAAAQLMTRHVVLFIAIGQPALQTVADRRPATVGEMFETAAAQTLAVRRARLLASIRAAGALVLETNARQLTAAAINGYLDVRAQGRL